MAIAKLFHHRWTVPLLADLHRHRGARYVELVNRLGVSRDSLSKTLQHLDETGLVIRNPGYGHPLRPEYILTDRGQAFGPRCEDFLTLIGRRGLQDLALKKWPMAVLFSIHEGAHRFNELRGDLERITPRALSTSLQQLEEPRLVLRIVEETRPPATLYQLTRRGAGLLPALRPLALVAG